MLNYRLPEHNLSAPSGKGILLNEKYLFCFIHSDGFTPDLKGIDLYVDRNYKFELLVQSMERPTNYSQDNFQSYLEGQLPETLQKKLVHLFSKDLSKIKEDYSDQCEFSHQGSQMYIINGKDGQIKTSIDLEPSNDPLEFKVEKIFFKFNKELNEWLNFLFESLLKNSTWSSEE